MAAQRRAQHFTQLFDDPHSCLTVVVTNEYGNRVERVEEEMRVHLRLQRSKTRDRELLGKTGDLYVPLARLDEVAYGVLDADDAEVYSYAKWKGGEDPAQPFHPRVTI